MAAGDEDEEQELRGTKNLTADWSHQHLARVSHAVDMRITKLELAQVVSGVCSQKAEANDQSAGAVSPSG